MDREKCTDEMLGAAVRKAVAVGLLPEGGSCDVIAENWREIKEVVEAALEADSRYRPAPNPVSPPDRWIEIIPDTRHVAEAERAGERGDGETTGFRMRGGGAEHEPD